MITSTPVEADPQPRSSEMNIYHEASGEGISSQRSPSSPGSARPAPLDSTKPLLWPGATSPCPASPTSPCYSLGTFEKIAPFRVPTIVVTNEEEAKQHDESDSSAEALVCPYTDPEGPDSEEEGYALSRWSESSSSSSSSSSGDEDSDYGTEEGDVNAGAVLMSFPSWGQNPMAISALLCRGDGTDEGGNNKLATVEEEDEQQEEDSSNHDGAVVEAVEEEYGRPWGGPIPRWRRLRSSDSLPMYNLGPRDFRHGSSKLKRASCPDDDDSEDDMGSDSDSDSDCSMVSPMSTEEGFDADAQVFAVVEVVETMAVVPMEGMQWQD